MKYLVLLGVLAACEYPSLPPLARGDDDGVPVDGAVDGAMSDAPAGCPTVRFTAPVCTPTLLSYFATDNAVQSIEVRGSTAYVAHYLRGLEIFDVSNPRAPVLRGRIDGVASDVTTAVSGNYIAYGEGNPSTGFRMVDVGNPAAPVVASTVSKRSDGSGMNTPRIISAGPGRPVWAVDWSGSITGFDISNAAAPVQIGNLSVPEVYDAAAVGDYLYVNRMSAGSGVDIYDVSAPAAARRVTTYPVNQATGTVTIAGARAYVPNGNASGVIVLDISDPAHPTCLAKLPLFGAMRVAADGSRIAVAMDRGFSGVTTDLAVVDVADPAHARLLGTWSGGDDNGRAIHAWVLSGGETVALSHIWNARGDNVNWGARLVDISGCH